jgi:hypothetical protein
MPRGGRRVCDAVGGGARRFLSAIGREWVLRVVAARLYR